MEGRPRISPDVISCCAGDAAWEVDGVFGLDDGGLVRGKAVDLTGDGRSLSVAVHVELEWGRSPADVGHGVQRRVTAYLERMAHQRPASVDVVVEDFNSPPSRR